VIGADAAMACADLEAPRIRASALALRPRDRPSSRKTARPVNASELLSRMLKGDVPAGVVIMPAPSNPPPAGPA
jgi:hypothetical protein